MEIILHKDFDHSTAESKKEFEFQLCEGIKFVMVQSGDRVVSLFRGYHDAEAERLLSEYPDASFLGAGTVRLIGPQSLHAEWFSGSCHQKFGYDTPQENADFILQEFRESINKLLGYQ